MTKLNLSQEQLKKLKTAVIGFGNMGKNHYRILSEISSCNAVCDVDTAKLNNLPCATYSSVCEMLQGEKFDAVVIATPTKYHLDTIKAIQDKNTRILLEKPIAETITQAKMIEKEYPNVFVGHVERFNPAILKFLELRDKLGDILSFSSVRVGINPPAYMKADVMLDLGIHDIDLANLIIGGHPEFVGKQSRIVNPRNVSDIASMEIRYSNGVIAVIQTNWITPIKIRRIEITGTRGYVMIDLLAQTLTFYQKDRQEILTYKCQGESLRNELIYFLNEPESNVKAAILALKILNNKL